MMFGLYFGNLLFYLTAVVLVSRGSALIMRTMRLPKRASFIFVGVVAAVLAPAVGSLGHVEFLIPFAALRLPGFSAFARFMLPLNIGLCVFTVVTTLLVYARSSRIVQHKEH